jgi:hypothetical protein
MPIYTDTIPIFCSINENKLQFLFVVVNFAGIIDYLEIFIYYIVIYCKSNNLKNKLEAVKM